HALGKEHTGQGDDEGLDLQVGHQEALDHAEGQADTQSQEGGGDDAAALVVQVHSAAHTHQSGHGAHGNIDTAGDHDDAHAAGEDDQGGVLIEDVKQSLGLQEAGPQEDHGADVHHEED